MKNFKSRKPIAWGIQVGSFPFNTDGFDVDATNVRITNKLISNGDDAIAALSADQFKLANVSNIHFDNIIVINAVYAARFKSWQGGQGLAKGFTWSNIRTYNVTFPIFVAQSYINQGGSQTHLHNGATVGRPNNSSVVMQDLTWSGSTGTINSFSPGDGSCASDPCWYNVGLPNLQQTEAVINECNTTVSCRNFKLENVQIVPQTLASQTAIFINATSFLNPKLGFTCGNGTFTPTPSRERESRDESFNSLARRSFTLHD